ncbi:MAG: PRD domain-containing protein, partial [Lachnospiraceae bacterium]|nr:PRD domain-containing protein [Lachnospiraceae bacterium]
MTSRQIAFIRLLSDQEDFCPFGFFAQTMGVSDKTLRRLIPETEAAVAEFGGRVLRRPGTGVMLEIGAEGKRKLLNALTTAEYHDRGTFSREWSQLGRRVDIALNLLLDSDENTSLSDLSYQYYVSKSSVAGDIKALEPFAARHRLAIVASHEGTKVTGRESDLRRALSELLVYILEQSLGPGRGNRHRGGAPVGAGTPGSAAPLFDRNTLLTILDIFTEDDLTCVDGQLKHMEQATGYRFHDTEYLHFSVNILVMIHRVRGSYPIEEIFAGNYQANRDDRIGVLAYELAANISAHYGFALSHAETAYLYDMFAVTHLGKYLATQALPKEAAKKTAIAFGEDFIDAFSVITGINLRMKSAFYINVIAHIEHMLTRTANSVQAKNPIVELLLQNYKGTVNVCQIICGILSEKFALPAISFDEVCFLMLYIQGELLDHGEKADVALITNQPNSIANLLKLRLSQTYPSWSLDCVDYHGFGSLRQGEYDWLVSTLPLGKEEHQVPYVLVSPLLDEKDIAGIDRLIESVRRASCDYLTDLCRMLRDLGDIGCEIDIRDEPSAHVAGAGLLRINALN